MGIAIRKHAGPLEVKVGGVTFEVRPLTYALKARVRAEVRKAGNGVVDEEAYARALYRSLLTGWQGLRYEDTGEEVPFGPCPVCSSRGGPPITPAGVNDPCPGCGGTGDGRDWALSTFPDDLWIPIVAEAGRALAREEERLGN